MTGGAQLVALAPNLWEARTQIRLPAGVILPLRMTVMRLPGPVAGPVVLHSPIPIDDALAEAIATVGPVSYIVVPTLIHHLYVSAAVSRYPQARVLAVAGMREKRPDLRIDELLSDQPLVAWGGALVPIALRGIPSLNETVFLHPESETLLVSDLVFNIRHPVGWATKLVLTLVGTRGRFRASREFRRHLRDKAAFAESIERVLAWRFRRVLMGHGEVFEADDAPGQLRAALWMLPALRG